MLITLLSAFTCAAPVAERFPFPMQLHRSSVGELPALVLAPDALEQIEPLAQIALTGAPLADGRLVDLLLKRADPDTDGILVVVDGRPVAGGLALHGSSWAGKVEGEPDSSVFLSFSAYGSRGWIYSKGEYHHVLAQPGSDGLWEHSLSRLVSQSELEALGVRASIDCGMEQLYAHGQIPRPQLNGQPQSMASTATLVCREAIETDYQLYQAFGGNLTAEQTYVGQLLGAANQRFVEQVNTVLDIVYLGFHTNSNDGWTSGDTGAGSVAMLYEFQAAWAGNLPNGANLAAFLSGASLGGGVAWLDTLCDSTYGFSVSGNITLQGGLTPFPVVQGPLNWDFMVFTHETGHNFGTPHTHDWCPVPLDQCAPSGYFGSCQTQQVCTASGTLMSYCHLCSGGMNNIYPYFHQACADLMRLEAENSCLGTWCTGPASYCNTLISSSGCTPAISSTGMASFTNPASFVVLGSNLEVNKNCLIFFGTTGQNSVPFFGGTLCVKPPLHRLPVQDSGGLASCTGAISKTLADYLAHPSGGALVIVGAAVDSQTWFRDPLAPLTVGLTQGLEFTVCP